MRVVLEVYPDVVYPLPGGSLDIPGLDGDGVISTQILKQDSIRRTINVLVTRVVQ